jgi:imidazolonepropionase-like amidohydrolase
VTIVAGTDSGTTFVEHGSLVEEIGHLERAGLSRLAALMAATSAAARELRAAGRLGCLAVGAVADLVVLVDDPLTDLGTLTSPYLVVQRGSVVAGSSAAGP